MPFSRDREKNTFFPSLIVCLPFAIRCLPSLELNHSVKRKNVSYPPFANLARKCPFLPLGPLLVKNTRTALLTTDWCAGLEGNAHGAVTACVVDDTRVFDIVAHDVGDLVLAGHLDCCLYDLAQTERSLMFRVAMRYWNFVIFFWSSAQKWK